MHCGPLVSEKNACLIQQEDPWRWGSLFVFYAPSPRLLPLVGCRPIISLVGSHHKVFSFKVNAGPDVFIVRPRWVFLPFPDLFDWLLAYFDRWKPLSLLPQVRSHSCLCLFWSNTWNASDALTQRTAVYHLLASIKCYWTFSRALAQSLRGRRVQNRVLVRVQGVVRVHLWQISFFFPLDM